MQTIMGLKEHLTYPIHHPGDEFVIVNIIIKGTVIFAQLLSLFLSLSNPRLQGKMMVQKGAYY